jgi:hypothetical protein
MLRFIAPKLPGWSPSHAYLMGPDDLALPAEITLDQDVIQCVKRVEGAAALAIQYPATIGVPAAEATAAPAQGVLTLRTALLPDRKAPYLLTLELARHQVMMMLTKLEEWALFETAPADPVMAKVEHARELYTAALVLLGRGGTGRFSPEAQDAAQAALGAAIDAGEALALLSARVQHARRLSGELQSLAAKPPPNSAITDHEVKLARKHQAGCAGVILVDAPKIGVSVPPAVFAPGLCTAIESVADFVAVPMRWSQMEPTEGRYTFAPTDRWIEWAVTKARLPVVAGPVLDFESGCVPDFVYVWEHDYESLRDVVIEHVKAVVTRYRRTVNTWTICGGLHIGSNFAISYEQAVDLTRVCVTIVRKLHPGAKVQVEISQPWGEYTAEASARAARSIPPAVYAELLGQIQLEIDAIALKVQMGYPMPGRSTRDLMSFSALLDRFAAMDKPVALTMLGAPSSPVNAAPGQPGAGQWRGDWTEQQQAQWLARAGAIAAGKPYVHSICWQELVDSSPPSSPSGGLVTAGGAAKPGLTQLKLLRDAMRTKRELPGA